MFEGIVKLLVAVLICSSLTPHTAHAEDIRLLPKGDGKVNASGRFSLNASDGRVNLQAETFTPFGVGRDSGFFIHGGLSYSRFDISDVVSKGGTAFAGLVWRKAIDDTWVIGANAYLDGASVDNAKEFMFGLSFGAELQRIGAASIFTAGANYYLPREDYTDPSRRGGSGVALREGFDVYSRYDWSLNPLWNIGVEGGVYDYRETRFAESEDGWRLELQASRYGLGSNGNGLTGKLGLRSNWDGDVDLVAGLQYEISLGRKTKSISSGRPPFWRREKQTKSAAIDGGRLGNTSIGARNPVVFKSRPSTGQRLRPPTRFIGFGSSLVDVREKTTTVASAATAQLQITYFIRFPDGTPVPDSIGAPDGFDIESNVGAFDATLLSLNGAVSNSSDNLEPQNVSFQVSRIPTAFVPPNFPEGRILSGSINCVDRTNSSLSFTQTFSSNSLILPLTDDDDLDCNVIFIFDILAI
ncbi:hypothetical protein [uncultured Tateyamaria sp.]|uniref:hypothetical protein n=1 Tax=uncultured Tateyamaria sp. TaxID=455651 RepID=UPI00260DCAA5|nr:hypothetical protein [uncultured Tateyamaria sp.]